MPQAHVFFSGHVQGVGFRYTTQRLAIDLGLKGWVKNLSDGRVEAIVVGDAGDIDRFLKSLDDVLGHHIRCKQIDLSDSIGQYPDFRIIF